MTTLWRIAVLRLAAGAELNNVTLFCDACVKVKRILKNSQEISLSMFVFHHI